MEDKKAWASPGPAGLMVLAFYLAGLWPVFTGLSTGEVAVLLVPLGFGGATVQLTCGIINLRNNEILSGNMMLAFSAFMWLGCISNLLKFTGVAPHTGLEFVDGTVFLVMGAFMVGFTKPFMEKGIIPGLFLIATDVFFLAAAFSWLTGYVGLLRVSGWAIPVIIITIIWSVMADVHNTLKQRNVVPTGKPMINQVKN